MSALRITAATIVRTMLAALPEGLRIRVAGEALLTVQDPGNVGDLRAVCWSAHVHSKVLAGASEAKPTPGFPPFKEVLNDA